MVDGELSKSKDWTIFITAQLTYLQRGFRWYPVNLCVLRGKVLRNYLKLAWEFFLSLLRNNSWLVSGLVSQGWISSTSRQSGITSHLGSSHDKDDLCHVWVK